MLWSLIKIVAFLAVVAAIVFGLAWILETPGEVRIAFGTREFFVSPHRLPDRRRRAGAGRRWCVLKLLGLLGAVIRFLLGDETAISRYFSRGRERRGYRRAARRHASRSRPATRRTAMRRRRRPTAARPAAS